MSSIVAGSVLSCRKRRMLSVLGLGRRGIGPFGDGTDTANSVVFFFIETVTFFALEGFHRQANTRPAKPPSVRLAGFPERGPRGGKTWPASLTFTITNTFKRNPRTSAGSLRHTGRENTNFALWCLCAIY